MLEIVNLTKKFEDLTALDNVNLTIADGSIFGLVGSNGSGKSTLLRIISGVYKADAGFCLIDGEENFDNGKAKANICYLPDTPYFIHQSNLNEMKRFYKSIYANFSDERFEKLLEIFPLDRKKRISSMSKGMQRQAALILSLSTKPKYLLLDEAFDGLDPVMRKVLKSLLAEGISDGMTAIIASHNLRDLDELCDTVGVVHKGNVLLSGDIDKLKNNMHKVQVIFDRIPDASIFDKLKPLSVEKTGSVVQLVVRGEEAEIREFLNKLFPQFVEILPPTFEEIFMYELEVNGYDANNILE